MGLCWHRLRLASLVRDVCELCGPKHGFPNFEALTLCLPGYKGVRAKRGGSPGRLVIMASDCSHMLHVMLFSFSVLSDLSVPERFFIGPLFGPLHDFHFYLHAFNFSFQLTKILLFETLHVSRHASEKHRQRPRFRSCVFEWRPVIKNPREKAPAASPLCRFRVLRRA